MELPENFKMVLVGPLPPPSGGMANQTRQLLRLLRADGVAVELVQVNAPYQPAWVEQVKGARAGARLLPYAYRLWRQCGDADLVHVMANSGWAWHLFAAPAVWAAKARGAKVMVNYRGGEAGSFFARSFKAVAPTLQAADRVVVPSGFLEQVFADYDVPTHIVPNIIDLARFSPRPLSAHQPNAPHLIVTRNLEPIYAIDTALRAFAEIQAQLPQARLTVAGSGPELANLQQLAAQLGVAASVEFCGRVDNDQIPALYQSADVVLNPTTADNMPISVLESLASGVPVVSTDVGGVPYLLDDERTGLLVSVNDAPAMAKAALRLLQDSSLYENIRQQGLAETPKYSWPEVKKLLYRNYRQLCAAA